MRMYHLGLLLALLCSPAFSQEVPGGVNYKKASDEINAKAKSLLEEALSKPPGELDVDRTFGKSSIMCGPFVWDLIGDSNSFKGSTPVMLIAGKTSKQGRGITNSDQKRLLWSRLIAKLGPEGSPVIRKASADEISFFWAMIPFDIEEPLLVADFGKQKLLVNFTLKDKDPHMFWIDLVQDLRTLK